MMQIGKRKLTLCKHGWMLHAGPYIGKCFELYGEYSESEVAVLRAFLRPGDTALDIGANIGDLTLPMARIVGDSGRVYAVESHIDNYHVLCANMALNGIEHVRPINCFIGDRADIDTAGRWGRFGFVSERWGADIVAVDDLDLKTCALMKIDVDGKELEVLRSASRLIAAARPILYFENDERDLSPPLLAHVLGLDYALYWHKAPIFQPDNFFGNQVNHWAPKNVLSLMMLAIPNERAARHTVQLRKVASQDEWWPQA
jgi:FkbM family methyltransferase